MSNIYDVFRGVQAQKTSCYDERSAAFITEGALSTDITHVRLNKTIKAAMTFNDKEGPDDTIVFTKDEDQLLKSDYFIYKNSYYLVYENVKLTDSDLTWKKQRAVECNVNFSIGNSYFNAFFVSALRRNLTSDLEKDKVVVPNEKSLIIVPSNTLFLINTKFSINGKYWKIVDFDDITNSGITYLYVERSYNANVVEVIDENPEPTLPTLIAMKDYTFNTLDAYFASTPKVDILEKKKTSIKFVVPLGLDTITISIKNLLGEIVETIYKVVL